MKKVLILLVACGVQAQPQPGAIRGTVVDARGGEPLARVEVQLMGADRRTVSGAAGEFSIGDLAPGEYTLHVSTVGYRLLKKTFSLAPGETKEFEVALTPESFARVEKVEVRADVFELARQDSPTELVLSGNDVKNLSSVLADDPLRAVQSLPGVASNDDFNSRFSIRGADYRRVGLYFDDILLHAPFHTVETQGAGGSLTVFNGDMVEELGLHSGAYPVRFGDRTAGALDVHTRDGSRTAPSIRAAAGAANAGVMAEGPLGGRRKGSWLAGARKSYLQYIIRRTSTDSSIAFGFWDTQARITYDVARRHTVTLSYLDGFSDLDRSSAKSRLGVNSIMNGGYHFTLASLAWRYSAGERLLITSRGAFMREKSEESNRDNLTLAQGHYGEWAWNTSATWMWSARTPLDAGVSIRRMRDAGYTNQYQFNPFAVRRLDDYRGSAIEEGGWLQQSWSAAAGKLHFAIGGRWDRHSIDGVAAFSPQASMGFAPVAATRFQFAWGQYVQFPEISALKLRIGSPRLLPERANHFVAAWEQRLDARTRFRAEFYEREDRDLLFRSLFEPRLIAGRIFNPPVDPPIRNSLRGYARGLEVFLQRRSANRLTGWISYALGYARLRDGSTGISFPSDQDQRHTINVYGGYRLRPSVNLSVKWLFGSGFPLPGFYRQSGSQYFLSEARNAVGLGAYQRTDARINKAWAYARWKLTFYGEVVNLLNRRNYRFDTFNGYNGRTGLVNLTLDRMFPILPSAGVLMER